MTRPTRVSSLGEALIKYCEGLHTLRDDGRIEAYQCPAGKWTIGWGCTRGVEEGMVIGRDQAQARLDVELRLHASRVAKLVTVNIGQYVFDALVSFDFNTGGLAGSTLLRKLNAGDEEGARAELAKWCKYTDPETGEKKTARGLARRRGFEAALWQGHLEDLPGEVRSVVRGRAAKPVAAVMADEDAATPAPAAPEPSLTGAYPIPQAVDAPPPPKGMAKSKTGQSAVAAFLAALMSFFLLLKQLLEQAKDLAETAVQFGIDHVMRALAADPATASMMGGSLLTAGLAAFIWRDRLKLMIEGG